ncbi:hypothetical protein BJP40_05925 [Streptomyces sp. CC53]|uniref:hypothetical protein n=1 Tax=Streptomyces sp. CC53 TaxID=1906740 RepID=UPI0008DCB4A1|nr:hypothetical protein [Streptomyces sp. CC53]OII61310.1 hypothetical protein BJP40_05925 [Streptomyces sp. CC53]
MGGHDQDQGDAAGPAPVPTDAAQARAMTDKIREAMDDIRRSVAVLAARVRDAHTARAWEPLGYPSWGAYCTAEFDISRAHAYRLLDIARTLGAIQHTVDAGPALSRTRDTSPAAALDYGLSQRALLAVSSRTDDLAQLLARRLTELARHQPEALEPAAVEDVVRQAVRDIRTAPTSAAEPSADPLTAKGRRTVNALADSAHQIGELMLKAAPAYLSDTEAADILALLCEEIGESLEHGLAARRYAITGDRRALHRTIL